MNQVHNQIYLSPTPNLFYSFNLAWLGLATLNYIHGYKYIESSHFFCYIKFTKI